MTCVKKNFMRRVVTTVALAAVIVAVDAVPAFADAKSKLAQEAAEYVMQKFGRQVVREGTETLATRIEVYALRHGDEFYAAIRKVGPTAFRLVEEGGEHAPQVIAVLSRYGEDGAVWVVSRPRAMQLFLQHGEEAAAVMATTRGVAEPALATFGKPSVGAFKALSTGQNVRRLAMVAEGGELAATGRSTEILDIIAKYGNPAMEFLWRHKEVLASGALLAAFIADPEPYIRGAKDITQVLAENAVRPLEEAAGAAATQAAKNIDSTKVACLAVIVAAILVASRWLLKSLGRRCS